MLSSGTTAVGTSDANPTVLIAPVAGEAVRRVVIINEGAVPGFASIDNGTTWVRIPAAAAATSPVSVVIPFYERPHVLSNGVLIKRDGGSDMTDVYGYAV